MRYFFVASFAILLAAYFCGAARPRASSCANGSCSIGTTYTYTQAPATVVRQPYVQAPAIYQIVQKAPAKEPVKVTMCACGPTCQCAAKAKEAEAAQNEVLFEVQSSNEAFSDVYSPGPIRGVIRRLVSGIRNR
jgi:hypothetical protein